MEERAHYERALPGTDDKTYVYLYTVMRRRVELHRQDSKRKALLSHHSGGGSALAMPADKKGGEGRKRMAAVPRTRTETLEPGARAKAEEK